MSTIEHDHEVQGTHSSGIWVRGLIMLFFLVAFSVAHFVLNFITVVQFLWMLITGGANRSLARFGQSLAQWLADVVRFQTGVSDVRPMPWSDWPSGELPRELPKELPRQTDPTT